MVDAGIVLCGAGGSGWEAASAELHHWQPDRWRFAEVTVPGPLAADRLEHVGIAAPVVGDLSRLLGRPRPPVSGERPIRGINVSIRNESDSASQAEVIDALVDALRVIHPSFLPARSASLV